MPQISPDALPRGCPVDSLPGWRRPVLVVTQLGQQCQVLDELLAAILGTGAEPAALCLAPRSCPQADADAPEMSPCPSQAPGRPARTVQFRRIDPGDDGRRGRPRGTPGRRDLKSAIEDTVRSHAGDGVLALNLSPAADHTPHHRAAQAALQAASGLGLHALVDPGRARAGHRVQQPG